MTAEEKDIALVKCIETYGPGPQVDMCIEEMSELTKALLKYRRAHEADLEKMRLDIIDELADVEIMCRQMELLFKCKTETEKRIEFKIQRQLQRIGAGRV